MIKQPYDYVLYHVNKMYQERETIISEVDIDKCCQVIAAFITACGWTEDEFMKAMIDGPTDRSN